MELANGGENSKSEAFPDLSCHRSAHDEKPMLLRAVNARPGKAVLVSRAIQHPHSRLLLSTLCSTFESI